MYGTEMTLLKAFIFHRENNTLPFSSFSSEIAELSYKMSTTLTIHLKRASKVYHEGESIAGVVVVDTGGGGGETRHEGLALVLEGAVGLQLSTKHTTLLDARYNNIKSVGVGVTRMISNLPNLVPDRIPFPFRKQKQTKEDDADSPLNLIHTLVELAPPGKIPSGVTEIPFEVPLVPRSATSPGYPGLLETYHGVFVNVMYTLKATMKRSFLNKSLNVSSQIFMQYRHQEAPPVKPVRCEITPTSIRGACAGGAGATGGGGGRHNMPSFHMYAELDSTVCPLDKPITGMIRVDECSVAIKSIELQLVRVETCGSADHSARDATEIQNIQAASGCGVDVPRGRPLPLHMVLPRLFTCPTTATPWFNIEFELNIAVIFEDDYLVTENFPILLLRSK